MDREFLPPLPPVRSRDVASVFTFKVVAVLHVICVALLCFVLALTFHQVSKYDRQIELVERV